MMKKIFMFFFFILAINGLTCATEGMWIPILIQQLNINEMQSMGFRLTAEDVYSINHSSMKDAIVQFGGGCTAVIVSSEGLILTNHHCGLGAIQHHSSIGHDYLANGFWAGSKQEELSNPGLTINLLKRIEDVTEKVLRGVNNGMSQAERAAVISKNSEIIEKEAVKGTPYEAKVRSFFYGNQFYLLVTEVFKDIRLVGAPPESLGQFGGDNDNWMWPRHGADFSIFRIYANKENKPAEYSKENIPFKPDYFFPVSIKGYHQGDFTLVFGYPGLTREYLTSFGINLIANQENPVRIRLRQERLDIMNQAMNESAKTRIQYTSKHQGIANGWKKMIGESRGIKQVDAIRIKQEFERRFREWTDSVSGSQFAISSSQVSYKELLKGYEKLYSEYTEADMASVYLNEGGLGIEIVRFAGSFRDLVRISKNKGAKPEEVKKSVDQSVASANGFFRDYQPAIDKKIMTMMLGEMKKNMSKDFLPDIFSEIEKNNLNNIRVYTAGLFGRTIFTDSTKLKLFFTKYKPSEFRRIENDPAYKLAVSIYGRLEKNVLPVMTAFSAKTDSLQRLYMAAQMEMQKEKRFYPDANSTIRVAYGNIEGYHPADATTYNYFTTTAGLLEKEDTAVYDYRVIPKMKKLLLERDFGRYADQDGTLHVAFIASNHTSGGNSGSPVFNGNGQLIGLNYDRNWEGTMSDLLYDPDQCRNISLDIRYCLFIIDKFAGAKNIIAEMKILE